MERLSHCWAWHPAQPSRIEQPVTLLRLQGPDALRFLHGQSSQAIEAAEPGDALATCLISPTARMRALAQVLVDADGAWLLIEAGDAEAVRSSLDRVLFPADRVALGALQAAALITPIPADSEPTAAPVTSWQLHDGRPGVWQLGDRLLISAESCEEHCEESCEERRTTSDAAVHRLRALPQLTALEQERWRLQQGWPSAPNELNDDTNPFELGLAERVSLSKGCYVGQETLAKLATYDGVKQQLRRWCCLQPAGTSSELTPGQSLVSTAGERSGVITSALGLPQADGSTLWLGLALVRRGALQQTTLTTEAAGSTIALTLSKPSAFVDPPVGAAQRPG